MRSFLILEPPKDNNLLKTNGLKAMINTEKA